MPFELALELLRVVVLYNDRGNQTHAGNARRPLRRRVIRPGRGDEVVNVTASGIVVMSHTDQAIFAFALRRLLDFHRLTGNQPRITRFTLDYDC